MGDQIGDNVKIEASAVEKKQNEVVKTVEHVKERKRNKEEKTKKKDDKRPAEQFLRSLSDVHSVEEKLELMCKKYSETVDENRKLQMTIKQYDKKMLTLQREKEQFQSERSKAALTRRRLESLCRELQKQNKTIKEESLLKIREQEEIRKQLSEKFQCGLAHIKAIMNQNIEKNAKMYEENLEMNKKCKAVYEHVELKEQELLKVHQQMKLELQMADVEHERVKMKATAEKKELLKEKQQLLYKLTECQAQIRELQATEVALRSQVSMYTDKYDEFQNALTRSNKVYGEFNEEMENMSKKILMLEKETSLWKQRWENSHAALLEMAADKQQRDIEIATLSKKLALLQDLCKVFQCERTNLLAQLKMKNKASQPETPAQEESSTQENNKSIKQVDELSKDCVKLQNTFGQLQDSLSMVSEAIQKGLVDEPSEGSTAESKKDTESSQAEKEKLDTDTENKEIERLECKDEDTSQKTGENSDSLEPEVTEVTEEVKETEVLTGEKSEDTKESIKEENTTDESSIKETKLSKEDLNTEPVQELCSSHSESDAMIEDSNKKLEECNVESENSEKPVCTKEDTVASQPENINVELVTSRLDSEEPDNIELNGNNVCDRTKEEIKQEVNTNVNDLYHQVESLHNETENIIEQLYEAIDSVRQESVKDSNETLKNAINSIVNGDSDKNLDNVNNENGSIDIGSQNEQSNDRLDGGINSHEVTCIDVCTSKNEVSLDTVPIENIKENINEIEKSNRTTEQVATSVSVGEILSKEQSLKMENSETKNSKPVPIKNGKRRKK